MLDIQKVFELTTVFVEILQFFVSENQIETPLLRESDKQENESDYSF
jgi:hypothetical protein